MAKLYKFVDEAIRKLDDINENRYREDDGRRDEEKMEIVKREAEQKMKDEANKWWSNDNREVTGLAYEMANFFTEDMSASLQENGRYYARMYITSINQKAERYFEQEWAKKTIRIKINIKQ